MKKKLIAMAVILMVCLCACGQKSKECSHEWKNGVCSLCQEVCMHNRYADGICKRCGLPHQEHHWWTESSSDGSLINDVCEICGYKCMHTALDINHVCAVCGKTIEHRYSDETHTCIAPQCGAYSQYFYEGLPDGYTEECAEQGTITELIYSTPMYIAEQKDAAYQGKMAEKTLYVYLPYNYDASKQYDILYLIHGRGGEPATWLIQQEETRNTIDHMIQNKDCEPCIIVTPSYYYGNPEIDEELLEDGDDFPLYFYMELRDVIIPLIESTYSTCAGGDVSDAGLTASRAHRAIAGFSRGSNTTMKSGMMHCLDWFGYFGCFNAVSVDGAEVNAALTSERFAQYDVYFWYNGVSRCDYTRSYHMESYFSILDNCDKLAEGINTVLVDKYGFEHNADNATLDLFNFVKFDMFKHGEK